MCFPTTKKIHWMWCAKFWFQIFNWLRMLILKNPTKNWNRKSWTSHFFKIQNKRKNRQFSRRSDECYNLTVVTMQLNETSKQCDPDKKIEKTLRHLLFFNKIGNRKKLTWNCGRRKQYDFRPSNTAVRFELQAIFPVEFDQFLWFGCLGVVYSDGCISVRHSPSKTVSVVFW